MSSQVEQLRSRVAQQRWAEASSLLAGMPLSAAVDAFAALNDDQQQELFRLLPTQVAAAALSGFPYYHQYILLYARPVDEMREILDQMNPDERMLFFDELPEEAWQRLMNDIGELDQPAILEPKASAAVLPARPALAPQVPAAEPVLETRGVEKSFVQPTGERIQVIAPLDLRIYPGTIVALLGASGCGKSTLLRILSGLAQPSAGEVLWNGRPLSEAVPNVAIVFQSFALFPWLTVLENVEAALLARGMDAAQRQQRALSAIETVGLKGFETAYPKELSGGMRQRVGFARALVVQPEVLFMDEPFSALDVLTAETLRSELLELWVNKKINTRTIFIVTHNIEEAVSLADRVIVLGRNPARIRADFRIPLAQPRDRKSPQFLLYVDFIYKVMTKPDAEVVPPTLEEPRRMVYQLLPHAIPTGIAGLLELLVDGGGEEDMYHLADRLVMEVDDLLPILDAAALLGFATLEEGDAKITPAGKAFAEADIVTRKQLFREAALEHVLLFRQIVKTLQGKSDHSIPIELFKDVLDEHFPETQVERQLETALSWARYCELFTYDSESGRLSLRMEEGATAPPQS
jgi:NitT/TauT family transport system ATP-binding protein